MLGCPGGFRGGGTGFGIGGSSFSKIARIALDARGEREAIGGDRVAEQGSDRSVVFGGKIRLHPWNMRRKGFEGEFGPRNSRRGELVLQPIRPDFSRCT